MNFQNGMLLGVLFSIVLLGFSDNVFAEDFDLNLLDRFNPAAPGETQNSIGAVYVDEIGTLYLTTTHPQTRVKVYDSDRNLILFINSEI